MFQVLEVTDFQAHKFRRVKLASITSFVGLSDAGKTALMRAMGAVCLNKPADKGLVKDGRKAFTVRLKCDGRWVTRKRGKRTNLYLLDGKEFAAFGSKVPDEVRALLNVDDGNFQHQLDKHFWFGDTGGQVSKHLNEIVNLELIDKSLAFLSSEVRKAKADYDHTTERYKQAKQTAKDLEWVEEFCADVDELSQLESDHSAILAKTGRLSILIDELRKCVSKHRNASQAILDGEKAKAVFKSFFASDRKCNRLEKLVRELEEVEELVSRPVPDLTELKRVRAEGDELDLRVQTLDGMIDQITELEAEVCHAESKLSQASKRLEKLSLNRRCPTCGQKVPHSPSSCPTSTSPTRRLSRGLKRTPGKTSSSPTSPTSGISATNSEPPW